MLIERQSGERFGEAIKIRSARKAKEKEGGELELGSKEGRDELLPSRLQPFHRLRKTVTNLLSDKLCAVGGVSLEVEGLRREEKRGLLVARPGEVSSRGRSEGGESCLLWDLGWNRDVFRKKWKGAGERREVWSLEILRLAKGGLLLLKREGGLSSLADSSSTSPRGDDLTKARRHHLFFKFSGHGRDVLESLLELKTFSRVFVQRASEFGEELASEFRSSSFPRTTFFWALLLFGTL